MPDTPGAASTVADRIFDALLKERILATPARGLRARLRADPAGTLAALAEAGALDCEAPNLKRALAEIEDGVVGLERARRGIAERWAAERAAHDPESATAFSDLVEAARRRCPAGDRGPSALLARLEQIVCEGHGAHPAAKTCLGLGDAWRDVLPEQVERVELRFVALDPGLVEETGAGVLGALSDVLPETAAKLRRELAERGIPGFAVVAAHPWQLEHVLRDEFAAEIAAGSLVVLSTAATAEPLMSVRTMRVADGSGAAHVKLALEAQLTGAVRGFSAGAAAGPLLSAEAADVLAVDAGLSPRTSLDEPAFDVARDLGATRFSASSGRRARCLGSLVRRDPLADARDGDVALPVAALTAANPLTGRPVLADLLYELRHRGRLGESAEPWFRALADVLVAPALGLLARWGIALEPHPQNVVLVLRDGVPARAVVRDFGGARLVPGSRAARRPGAAARLAPIAGTALEATGLSAAIDKVTYPLLVNLVDSLARVLGRDRRPAEAWAPVALAAGDELRRLAIWERAVDGCPGPAAATLNRVFAPELPRKRLLAMRLSGAVTEQAYAPWASPLHEAARRLASDAEAERRDADAGARETVARRLGDAARVEGVDPARLSQLAGDERLAAEALGAARYRARRRHRALAAQARLRGLDTGWAGRVALAAPGLRGVAADALAAEGHSVHPLSKLRRGLSEDEIFAYSPEQGRVVDLVLLAVERGLVEDAAGRPTLGETLAHHFPRHWELAQDELDAAGPPPSGGWALVPVHPWQLTHVLRGELADALSDGTARVVDSVVLPARPTISLRTLVPHAPGAAGARPFVKVALDVTLTSTRRSISQHSALGTPAVADAVARILEQAGAPVGVLKEVAGVAYRGDSGSTALNRGLSALVREPTPGLGADAALISACALRGLPEGEPSPLKALAGGTRGGALEFFRSYARDLLGAALPAMWLDGVAIEAHLQNTLVEVAGLAGRAARPRYRGLWLRDFSGLRIYRPRYTRGGRALPTRPGAITATDRLDEFLDKGHYAAIFGNLAGIVDELDSALGGGLADELWALARSEAAAVADRHRGRAPEGDLRALEAESLRQKAFVTMALEPEAGDRYVAIPNPLGAAR